MLIFAQILSFSILFSMYECYVYEWIFYMNLFFETPTTNSAGINIILFFDCAKSFENNVNVFLYQTINNY